MTKTTTVRDASGNVISTSTTKGGCGCGSGCLWVLLVVVVVGGPWAWFPHWLAILAYILEGVLAVAFVGSKVGDWRARRAAGNAGSPAQ